MNNQKSINWINVIKALSIIAVYFVHCELHYDYVIPATRFVYPWYVNAFFFVSGYLLFWKQLSQPRIDEDRRTYIVMGGGKTLIFNILYRIVIPSIIFSAIEFFPSSIIQGREMSIGNALFKTIGGGTYWFTSALVVAELVLLLLFCSRKRNIWFYVAFCFLFGLLGLFIVRLGYTQNSIYAWKRGLISLIFLSLGGLYWRYENIVDKLMKWWFALPLLVVYVVMILFCNNINPLISTMAIQPMGFVTSIISCLLLVWLCKCMSEIKPLTFIGQNSLGFYFLSGAAPIPLALIARKAMAGSYWWVVLAIFVLSLIVAYIAVIIINRWLPWLWDLRKIKNATSNK